VAFALLAHDAGDVFPRRRKIKAAQGPDIDTAKN
jgi:hypothetical protein